MSQTVRSILGSKGREVWFIAPQATVLDALSLMADKDIGALMVISGDELVGVVSERDYARKVILMGKSSKDLAVSEIMTSPPITVTPDHTVEECMRIMTHHHVRHLPVIDGEKLTGIVSIGDLVNQIISDQAEEIARLNTYIAGDYPA
jgi:CBS domain-containing protein